jgi:hypothetical protein
MPGLFLRFTFEDRRISDGDMTTRTPLAAFSNEAKIQRGLDLLGCAAVNFCSLVGICGKTRFMEAMNGVPGRHFNDKDAQTFLSYMERLYDLQSAIDDAARDPETGHTIHVPMDFTRYEEIGEVLAIRLAQAVCLEDNDHQLDAVAQRAMKAFSTSRDHNVVNGGRE